MIFIFDLKKGFEESELQYIWRICSAKDSGTLDKTWTELADILNAELRDEDNGYNESAYRKKYQQAKQFYEEVFAKMQNDSYIKEMQKQKDLLYKEKRKLYDQRREYNKLLVSDARAEHLTEELIEAAKLLNETKPLVFSSESVPVNKRREAVLFFADWHYGMVTDNIWNKYNVEICRSRVKNLIDTAKEIIKGNGIDILHLVMLGDAAHGSIHTTCRINSEEKTCDQLMQVSELFAEAINELSNVVNHVTVYSCYGNHLRTVQHKDDSIHSDNMEKIIPWWMKERLKDNGRVNIVESEFDEFTKLNVLGRNIVCVHGDLDNFRDLGVNVNTLFSRKFGETIDYTVSADKHHLEEFERFDIESILVRSLCGTDDHANNKRLYGKPGQTLMIFNDVYGRESTYHIPL